ncbi:hypothetical protein HY091_00985 [Candidatus Kaiserbacteria bacterium]|nr:hypothetical protein [Candidatus Kaiserbacteria bacterium]
MPIQDTLNQVNTLATHTALSAWAVAGDFVIVLIIFGALFFFAWYVGRGPFVALLLALYAAYAVYLVFPYAGLLPTAPALTALLARVALYGAFVVVVYLILRRVVVSDFLYVGLFGLIALSFLGATFLLALAYQAFPVSAVYHFTPAVDAIFAPKAYFFWWFIAPLLGLFFLAR